MNEEHRLRMQSLQAQAQNQQSYLQGLYGAQQQSGLMDILGGGGVPAPPQQYPFPAGKLEIRTSNATPKKELSMFKTVASDVKSFILEHRSTLYFLAFALLVDHFLFQDAFRNRLKAIADGLIKKVEDKVAQS